KTLVEYAPRSFGKHFGIAQKLGANIVALIGENELKTNTIYVKNINTQEIKNLNLEEF
ncbi:MAG: histidine--tRNA ligase, partial [Erysipelotrichia bacterium]|nr:histidine--tRNA ligase [Erysipelotrichia bacterium]